MKERLTREAAKRKLSVRQSKAAHEKYGHYAKDPVAFAVEVLGYTLSADLMTVLESVRDNRVTVVRSANSVGKTTAAAILAIWFYFCHANAKVHTLAAPPKSNLETKLWGEINRIRLKCPHLFEGYNQGLMWISRSEHRRDATDFIEGIAVPQDADPYLQMASVAGSHAPSQLYEVDEGDGVDDPVFDGIDSCMTGPHERLVIFYNPRHEKGRPWRLEIEKRANVIELSALTHPHVVTDVQTWPGAVTREVTVKRIQEQTRPLEPDEQEDGECFRLPDYLIDANAVSDSGVVYPPLEPGPRKVIEPEFWHVVLGKFSPRGGDRFFFNRPWLAGRLAHWMQRDESTGRAKYPTAKVIQAHEGQLRTTWEIYEEPEEGEDYVLGADVAKGVVKLLTGLEDRDFHEAAVYNRRTMKQVAAGWGREDCTPEEWAGDLVAAGGHFNGAYLIVEVNNYGRSTLNEIINHHKYSRVYYRTVMTQNELQEPIEVQEWGFETTPTSKTIRDGYLRQLIKDSAAGWGRFDVRSPRQIGQLMNYGHLQGAKAGALVGHDDAETAISLCAVVLVEEPWTPPRAPREEAGAPYASLYGRRGR